MGQRTSELVGVHSAYRIRAHYQQVVHGVRAPSGPEVTTLDKIRAVALLYPDAVFCGWTAAGLHGVPYSAGHPVEIQLPYHRRRSGIIVRRSAMPDGDVATVDGFRVTTPVRTAIDLARYVKGDEAVAAVDQCLRVGEFGVAQVTARDVAEYLAEHRHLHRCTRVAQVLAQVDGRAESPWETYARLFLRRSGLTMFVPQTPVTGTAMRLDLGAEEFKVAVEYEGEYHADRAQHRRDVARWNRLRFDHGWEIVLAAAPSLHAQRAAFLRQVQTALASRGWTPQDPRARNAAQLP